MALPPASALDRKADHVEYARLARLESQGFDSREFTPLFIRSHVGRNCDAWSEYSLTGEVSTQTLATIYASTYLEALAAEEHADPLAAAPPVWDCGLGATGVKWAPLDTEDAVAAVAARWRSTTDVSEAHWDYVRALEVVIARQLDENWGVRGLDNTLSVLVRLWGLEYTWRVLELHSAHADDTPVPASLLEWQKREQVETAKANQEERVAHMTMAADIAPGETDRYARSAIGVVASNISNIFEFNRTHVQARGLQKRGEKFDEMIGAGFVVGALIDRKMNARLTLPWVPLAVFFDLDLQDHDLLDRLELRRMPYLLLHAGVWYIGHKNHFTYRCRDLRHATMRWFDRMRDEHQCKFQYLTTSWDLGIFFRDRTFPFARYE